MNTKITLFRNLAMLLLFLFLGTKQLRAQTTLAAGDIAFTGYNSVNGSTTNDFTFIILRTGGISNGTVIYFTDNGWNTALATPALGTAEGIITWTATSAVAQFTEITIKSNNTGSAISSFSSGSASLTGTFLLSGSGDQVLAYQNSGSPTFISAIQMNAEPGGLGANPSTLTGWDDMTGGTSPYGYSTARSAIPPGLTNGTNAVMVVTGSSPYTEWDDAKYNCGGSSGAASVSALSASINTLTNWGTANSTPYPLPSGCTFSVGAPPSITGQPSNSTICAAGITSFGIIASNATSYVWEVSTNGGSSYTTVSNGGVYSTATTATLTITGATAGMNGYMYHCIASGSIAPAATSNAATLTVNSAPAITTNPSNSTACIGNSTTFSIAASNATGYQWQENAGAGYGNITNGGIYSNATTATLTLTTVSAGLNGRSYRCIATGSCTPAATSSGATLTVSAPPSVTGQPSASTICAGNNTTFSITASDATGYQWQVDPGTGFTNLSNSAPYSGVTTATLTITGATAGLNGYSYRCVVSGSCTPTATSNGALLTVNGAPAITGNPSNSTTCSNTAFSVTASNATGYQWQVNSGSGFGNITNGGVYSNATTATLNITGATAGMNGYTYQCIVSGACTPNATSTAATLTVQTPGTWTGNSDQAWNNTANWTCGTLPTATTDVIIPNVINLPIININSAICNNLTINSGGSVSFTGTTNVLTVKGNITNNGTLSGTGGKILLSGTTQTIPAISCKDLEIAGGGLKTLAGSITLTGTLTLTNGYLQLGNNTLTLGNSAVVSGGSATSYVVTNGSGKLTNQNIGAAGKTGAVVFPVGSNSLSYTPATLTNAGTADNFSVNVFDNIYSSYNNDVPSGAPQALDAVAKTWLVSEATAGGSNATLTLQWGSGDQLTGFDKNNCYLLHYSNTTNTFTLGTMGIASGTDPFSMSMTGITSFSPFGVGSIGSPLSVDLVSFGLTGRAQKGKTDLQWVTANEKNMSRYQLERSDDGINYAQIASISAVNQNSDHQHIYNYEDATADNAPQHYYRLKMINQDGSYKYSNVIAVSATELNTDSYEIFPNPVSNSDLFIKTSNNLPAGTQVQIIDMQGRTLLHATPENWQNGTASVNVKSLPSGIYLLYIISKDGEQISTIRFTKK